MFKGCTSVETQTEKEEAVPEVRPDSVTSEESEQVVNLEWNVPPRLLSFMDDRKMVKTPWSQFKHEILKIYDHRI